MAAYGVSISSRTQEALVIWWFMLSAYPAEHKRRWSYVGLVISILSITQEALVIWWFMLSTHPAEHKRRWSYVNLCCQHTKQNIRGVGLMLVYVVNIPSRTQEALVLR